MNGGGPILMVMNNWEVCPKCAARISRGPFVRQDHKERCRNCGRKVKMIRCPDDGSIPVVDEKVVDDAANRT